MPLLRLPRVVEPSRRVGLNGDIDLCQSCWVADATWISSNRRDSLLIPSSDGPISSIHGPQSHNNQARRPRVFRPGRNGPIHTYNYSHRSDEAACKSES